MKNRRILSFLLACTLAAGLLTGAAAAQTPTASLSSGTVEAGGSVTLTVTLTDNPGMAACLLYFYYDTDVFAVTPSKDIRLGSDFRGSGGLLCNTIELARQNGRYNGKAGEDGVLALWYNGSGVNTTGNGQFLTITLYTAADAKPGDYSIGLGYSAADTQNEAGEAVALSTSGGTVTVTASSAGVVIPPVTEAEEPEEPELPVFTDISGNWAEEYILKAAELKLVEGYGNGLYKPDEPMTRAEFVTILWRAMGEPEPEGTASFSDLTQDWYRKSVAWAEENSIINGFTDGTFRPRDHVTREQLVTILHRMAGTPVGMESLFTSVYDAQFTDSAKVQSYAKQAMYWAIYEEIYCGESSLTVGTELVPRGEATRAQIAVMIVRYLEDK